MTDTPEDEIILEPGDPGYVDPNAPPPPVPETAAPAPPPQDLQHVRNPKETDAEFLARTRGAVVQSESPTDVVPNTPQITFSPQEPEQMSSPQTGETQEAPTEEASA